MSENTDKLNWLLDQGYAVDACGPADNMSGVVLHLVGLPTESEWVTLTYKELSNVLNSQQETP